MTTKDARPPGGEAGAGAETDSAGSRKQLEFNVTAPGVHVQPHASGGGEQPGRVPPSVKIPGLAAARNGQRAELLTCDAGKLCTALACDGSQLAESLLVLNQRLTPALPEAEVRSIAASAPRNPPDARPSLELHAVGVLDFLAEELPPPEMILAPWLPTRGIAMIHAKRGVGKTHACVGIACAVATGGSFLKWSASKPRGVLYVDGEMSAARLQERFRREMAAQGHSGQVTLNIVTPDKQPGGMPNLSTPEGQAAVDRLITEEIELIIADPLSTLARSGKENEAESWEPIQTWALRWRARGKTVLFAHHSGKDGRQRGTSRREDVMDAVIDLTHPEGQSGNGGAVFRVTFEKNRHFYGEDAEPFVAHLDECGKWQVKKTADSRLDMVEQMLGVGRTHAEIAKAIGASRATVSRLAKKVRGAQ